MKYTEKQKNKKSKYTNRRRWGEVERKIQNKNKNKKYNEMKKITTTISIR